MSSRKMLAVIVVLCLIVSFVIGGCTPASRPVEEGNLSPQEENKASIEPMKSERLEASIIYLSLEEAIDKSCCVVSAKLNSINPSKTKIVFDFSLTNTIIGDMNDARFLVDEGYGDDYSVDNSDSNYSTYETDYKTGKEYILVLTKISSVYSERDQHMFVGDTFIELDDAGNIVQYRRYGQTEDSPYKTAKEFSNYALSITDDSKERLVYGIPFTRSDKISDIVNASQYIVKAVVSELKFENPDINRDTYICRVTERLRGSTRDDINIVLFKNTVTIGKEYLFLLNKDTEDSLIYALSSVNSVIDLDKDTGTVDEITALISKQ